MDIEHIPKITTIDKPGSARLLRPLDLDSHYTFVEPVGDLLSIPQYRVSDRGFEAGVQNQTDLYVKRNFSGIFIHYAFMVDMCIHFVIDCIDKVLDV